jgi:hypothetical protein
MFHEPLDNFGENHDSVQCQMRDSLSHRLTAILRKMMKIDVDCDSRLRLHGELDIALEEYRAHIREHKCGRTLTVAAAADAEL